MHIFGAEGTIQFCVNKDGSRLLFSSVEDVSGFLGTDAGQGAVYMHPVIIFDDGSEVALSRYSNLVSCEFSFDADNDYELWSETEIMRIGRDTAVKGLPSNHVCYGFGLAFMIGLASDGRVCSPLVFEKAMAVGDSGFSALALLTVMVRSCSNRVFSMQGKKLSADLGESLLRQGHALFIGFESDFHITFGDGETVCSHSRHGMIFVFVQEGYVACIDQTGMRPVSRNEFRDLCQYVVSDSVVFGVRRKSLMVSVQRIADWIHDAESEQVMNLSSGSVSGMEGYEWTVVDSLDSLSVSVHDSLFFDRVAGYVARCMPQLDVNSVFIHVEPDDDERDIDFVRPDAEMQAEKTSIGGWSALSGSSMSKLRQSYELGW